MYMSDFIYPIYVSLGESEEAFYRFLKVLCDNFDAGLTKQLPKSTIADVGDFLKSEYLAREIVDDTYLGLDEDCMVNVDDIVIIYRIDDPQIMNMMYTKEERDYQLQIPEEGAVYENKNMYNIVLESKDNISISAYTTLGMSIRLSSTMYVITRSIRDDDVLECNPWFADYLVALWWSGFLCGNQINL